ncbi:MAG: DUF3306 domain-containing protein [Pseudomonadota bacterium]
MDAEHFFSRWSARKAEARTSETLPAPAPPASLPTLDDVATLTAESDFAPFLARGVDRQVQHGALKKLFADPRFNVMDGLDTYVEDFNTFDPIPPAMLALLNHGRQLLESLPDDEQLAGAPPPDDATI